MNRLLAGLLVLAAWMGGPLQAAGIALQDSQQVAPALQPLQVTIMCTSGKTFMPGGILRFMAVVRDAGGVALGDPVSYQWEVPTTLSLSTTLDQELLQVLGDVTRGCGPGQTYTFKVSAKSGTRVGTASYTITAISRDASPIWLKVNVKSAPASRTLRQGEPLVLTADLQPAGGGVSPSLVTYAWTVLPSLPGRLPSGPSLNLSSAQTQAMKAGQAYAFTLKVKIGLGEVVGTSTVNVVPAGAGLPLNRPGISAPALRPGEKPPVAPAPIRGTSSQSR